MLLGLIISTYLRNLLLQITAAIAASAARERSVYIHTGDLSAVLAAVLSAVFPVEDFAGAMRGTHERDNCNRRSEGAWTWRCRLKAQYEE